MNKEPENKSELPALKETEKKKMLDGVISKHAYAILKRIGEEEANVLKRTEEIALEYLTKEEQEVIVVPEDVADNLFSELEDLDAENILDNSGSTRHGYVDPNDLAHDMFEEAMEPYIEELREFQKLSMREKAKLHCMGILKGLYKFEKESKTEFRDWAADEPQNSFEVVFDEWKKGNRNKRDLDQMFDFVKENLPDWFKEGHT